MTEMDLPKVAGGRERPVVWVAVGCILLAAFGLRAWGVSFALPYVYHPDEPKIALGAEKILLTGDPNPRWYVYPSLYMYVQAGVFAAVDAFGGDPGDPLAVRERHYLAGRLTTCVLGTLTVLFVFLAARSLWGSAAGIGSAAVMAFCFVHVQCSKFITTDVPSGLFASVCLWASARGSTTARRGWFMVAGAAAGLAAAAKYNAGMCLFQPLGLWGANQRRVRSLISWTPAWIAVSAAGAFLVMMPWVFSDTGSFVEGLQSEMRHYRGGHAGSEGGAWWYYPVYLWRTGLTPGPTLLVVGGMVLAAVRDTRRFVGLITFGVLYYLLLASMVVRFPRNLAPVLPLLAVFAGYAVFTADHRIRALAWRGHRRVLVWLTGAGCVAAIFALPVVRIVQHNRTICLPDTRTIAVGWFEQHFPSGARVCMEEYNPPIDTTRFTVYWRARLFNYPKGEMSQCDCVVASSGAYQRYLDAPERYPEQYDFYTHLFSSWDLVGEVANIPGETTGPTIRIFRVPK